MIHPGKHFYFLKCTTDVKDEGGSKGHIVESSEQVVGGGALQSFTLGGA